MCSQFFSSNQREEKEGVICVRMRERFVQIYIRGIGWGEIIDLIDTVVRKGVGEVLRWMDDRSRGGGFIDLNGELPSVHKRVERNKDTVARDRGYDRSSTPQVTESAASGYGSRATVSPSITLGREYRVGSGEYTVALEAAGKRGVR